MHNGVHVKQGETEFKPIIIELKTVRAAKAFFDLIDYTGLHRMNSISKDQRDLICYLSNAVTEGRVVF